MRSTLQATARPFPSSGAHNGPDDPTPVAQCHAPAPGVEQLQCYCSTGLRGAGMVDAGAAVAVATEVTLLPASGSSRCDGGGGGLVSAPWVAGVVLATVALV